MHKGPHHTPQPIIVLTALSLRYIHRYERRYKLASGSEAGAEEGYEYIRRLGGGKATLSAWESANYKALLDPDEKAWKAYPFHAPKS